VNCLNFGNPEHPEVMWQFAEVVEGMSEACDALGIPVIGGNVSFYNESRGEDIDPTPVVGVIGAVDALTDAPPTLGLTPGAAIVLLGETRCELGGSEWATLHDLRGGEPPAADLDAGAALHDLVASLVAERAVVAVHDCSDGGLAVAVAEMAIAGGCGAAVDLAGLPGPMIDPAAAAFSESANRVALAVNPARAGEVLHRAAAAGVAAAQIGEAGGDHLTGRGAFHVPLADAAEAWTNGIPRRMQHESRRAAAQSRSRASR
jgi:phosphoribosylformylglycinamidine synthase